MKQEGSQAFSEEWLGRVIVLNGYEELLAVCRLIVLPNVHDWELTEVAMALDQCAIWDIVAISEYLGPPSGRPGFVLHCLPPPVWLLLDLAAAIHRCPTRSCGMAAYNVSGVYLAGWFEESMVI